MKLWHRGTGLLAFLPKLALAAMVLGAAVTSNGDGGFIHRVSYHPLGRRTALSTSGDTVTCTGGKLAPGDGTQNLEITGACTAGAGLYQYEHVNIYKAEGATTGGSLTFEDNGPINFWAKSIIIENHGSLIAGSPEAPFQNKLTIHLWGKQQGTNGEHPDRYYKAYGVPCLSPDEHGMGFSDCGIPENVWKSNTERNPDKCVKASELKEKTLPGGVNDCFYKYHPMDFDGANPHAFFGYKVLAVSYGGTLHLFGAKGATYPAQPPPASGTGTALVVPASDTGTSWTRLDATLKGGKTENTIVVADPTGAIANQWAIGDQIVVGSTDYLPGHAEKLTIESAPVPVVGGCRILQNDETPTEQCDTIEVSPEIQWPHNGTRYPLNETAHSGISRLKLGFDSIDTRAPVALLTRNITIESDPTLGAKDWPVTKDCDPKKQDCYFGGDTIFRQGFKSVQVQGVEFYQLGEGGRMGHYPVHFHLVRKAPPNTFVKDSSVWDSMTRWYVLHGAENVTLQRDVGYLSIGHGYYLEDGTESNNTLDANVGIFARGAIDNDQNPRDIPGILSAPFPEHVNVKCGTPGCPCPEGNPNATCGTPQEQVPYHSDIDHPSVFWIMNAANTFEYNMADGAGTCGFCYWLLPGYISGPSRHEHWSGYSAEQHNKDLAGTAPLKEFLGNSCSSAMNSFNVVGNTTACLGVVWDVNTALPRVKLPKHDPKIVPAVNAAKPRDEKTENYYPNVDMGGGHWGTRCKGADCAKSDLARCGAGEARKACMVTVLDKYTSSFNWAQHNVSAIWLRPQWSLVLQSAITDVQNGGLTFVTGGDYTHSSLTPGVWELARKSVFVGSTQPGNDWASEAGPFNPGTGLTCDTNNGLKAGNYCLSANNGISMPLDNFAVNQRLFNIYDGPAYEDDNGFLDITPTMIGDCARSSAANGTSGQCDHQKYMYEQVLGLPQDKNKSCYLPNAAIGWKQPNGFYYPPAFHSSNLFFDNVPIRHYVIEPSFLPDELFKTNTEEVKKRYCNWNHTMFNNFSDIDRQTELNDDDGSLTGLVNTISVNQDAFFDAPYSTTECKSDIPTAVPTDPTKTEAGTANTSPYDYVSTVIFPSCAAEGSTTPCNQGDLFWSSDCSNNTCFGVPLYRELATGSEKRATPPRLTEIRMGGENFYQRNTLTVNHGVYYMDTTTGKKHQKELLKAGNFTVFQKNHTYNVFLLFAKPSTTQEYQIYVGPGFNINEDLWMIRAHIATKRIAFDKKPWPLKWKANYAHGILTVTMNMDFEHFIKNYDAQRENDCSPESLCAWSGDAATGTCGCDISDADYPDPNLINQCNQTTDSICSWSSKDVDCPKGGCYGFSFKLPNDFETGKKDGLPPAPECFPKNPDTWDTAFKPASQDLAGKCFYGTGGLPIPESDFCSVP